jgi:predicted GIY-YIG superfamily endonuclease
VEEDAEEKEKEMKRSRDGRKEKMIEEERGSNVRVEME